MQVIEGAYLVTDALYERIKLDARHRGTTTVHQHRGHALTHGFVPAEACTK